MSTLSSNSADSLCVLRRQSANLITGGRVALLFLCAGFAVSGHPTLAVLAVPLAFITVLMDWLDGAVARRYGCESKVGSVLDIAGDRMVENVWWILFAWLRLVPLWVPVIVLSRGFITDAIRSTALSMGHTAFGKETMMRSRIGFALVASRASRGLYCAAKVLAFELLFAANALQLAIHPKETIAMGFTSLALGATYVTVVMCIVRGVPVVTAFKGILAEQETA